MKPEHITYTKVLLQNICSDIHAKCVASFLYVLYSFSFDPAQGKGYVALLALVIIDFVTGVAGAKKSGEEIKSAKIARTAVKILTYFMFLAAAHYVELAVPIGTAFVDETILAFLAVTELISVFENIGRMGYAVPKKLLNKLEQFRDAE